VDGFARAFAGNLPAAMTAKISRFQIHDELTAPAGSVAVLHGVLAAGGRLPNFLAVLGGAPAALRGYIRFRSELRHGSLEPATMERIALAIAEHHGSEPGIALHGRLARSAALGLPLDEVALARDFDSRDPREAALLSYLRALVASDRSPPAPPPMYLHEAAREAGWSDQQIIDAIAFAALESFAAMINLAGELPADSTADGARALRAA
jgi:alkylhydroperoxidase family enzyme